MAFSDMISTIADEISRSDYTAVQIPREINNAITFYQNKRFWFNQNLMVTLTTVAGQRYYPLPANFAAVLNVRSTLGAPGSVLYDIPIVGEDYLDSIDWTNTAVSSYIMGVSFFHQRIRVYPPPTAGLPIIIKGTVLLPTLTSTAATKSYTKNTAYTAGDTVLDQNGNIQTAKTSGTTGAAASKAYTANTAYSLNDTVLDLNGNTQTCTTAGISGYLAAVDATQWALESLGLTSDGTVTWQLTTKLWSTDYLSYTVDGSVTWQLTTALSTSWMDKAEELIRTRATRMIYQRYIHDMEQAQSYKEMEQEALHNLYEKNQGQIATGWVRPHL